MHWPHIQHKFLKNCSKYLSLIQNKLNEWNKPPQGLNFFCQFAKVLSDSSSEPSAAIPSNCWKRSASVEFMNQILAEICCKKSFVLWSLVNENQKRIGKLSLLKLNQTNVEVGCIECSLNQFALVNFILHQATNGQHSQWSIL